MGVHLNRSSCSRHAPVAVGAAGLLTRRFSLVALFCSALAACASSSFVVGTRGEALPRELYLGEFVLSDNAVVDGDTIRVVGLDSTLRLIGIDTEETFKHEEERRAYAAGFASYVQARRGGAPRPVKMATPMGDEAKGWAKAFFSGIERVRLERDDPKEVSDRYNRYLAYVLVQKNGAWLNYNIEAVRAGMGPYFTKYGNSRRFHQELVAAESEARAAKRGVWDPAKEHYPDYDERLAWWQARASFIAEFLTAGQGRSDFVVLTHADADARLRALVGQSAVVLGTVNKIEDKGSVTLVSLGTSSRQDFKLVVRDRALVAAAHLADFQGEPIRARGFVSLYRHARQGTDEPQIAIESAEQVDGSVASPKPVTLGVDEGADAD